MNSSLVLCVLLIWAPLPSDIPIVRPLAQVEPDPRTFPVLTEQEEAILRKVVAEKWKIPSWMPFPPVPVPEEVIFCTPSEILEIYRRKPHATAEYLLQIIRCGDSVTAECTGTYCQALTEDIRSGWRPAVDPPRQTRTDPNETPRASWLRRYTLVLLPDERAGTRGHTTLPVRIITDGKTPVQYIPAQTTVITQARVKPLLREEDEDAIRLAVQNRNEDRLKNLYRKQPYATAEFLVQIVRTAEPASRRRRPVTPASCCAAGRSTCPWPALTGSIRRRSNRRADMPLSRYRMISAGFMWMPRGGGLCAPAGTHCQPTCAEPREADEAES
jgi:hypothetical protein